VVGWPNVVVIDHAADAAPRGSMSGAQVLHAVLLASAHRTEIEQNSLKLMTYTFQRCGSFSEVGKAPGQAIGL
jgi:hypothetical protein